MRICFKGTTFWRLGVGLSFGRLYRGKDGLEMPNYVKQEMAEVGVNYSGLSEF